MVVNAQIVINYYSIIMTTQSDQQKRIMEHLARSTSDFNKVKLNSSERKQQIMEHVRLSKG